MVGKVLIIVPKIIMGVVWGSISISRNISPTNFHFIFVTLEVPLSATTCDGRYINPSRFPNVHVHVETLDREKSHDFLSV